MISRIMKYKTHVFLFLLLLTCRVYAQDVHLKLYEQQEPKTDQIDSLGYIREVFSPELLGYLPENRTGLNHAEVQNGWLRMGLQFLFLSIDCPKVIHR